MVFSHPACGLLGPRQISSARYRDFRWLQHISAGAIAQNDGVHLFGGAAPACEQLTSYIWTQAPYKLALSSKSFLCNCSLRMPLTISS